MLIASTSPYLVLFHQGYARLCLQQYEQDSSNLVAHLTNQFIQKKDVDYQYSKEDTVWSMSKLNDYINLNFCVSLDIEYDWVYNVLTVSSCMGLGFDFDDIFLVVSSSAENEADHAVLLQRCEE